MKKETLDTIDTNNQKALSILKGLLLIIEADPEKFCCIEGVDVIRLIETACDYLENSDHLFDESTVPGASE